LIEDYWLIKMVNGVKLIRIDAQGNQIP